MENNANINLMFQPNIPIQVPTPPIEEYLTSNPDTIESSSDPFGQNNGIKCYNQKMTKNSLCIQKHKNRILVLDLEEKFIKVFDMNYNYRETIRPNRLLLEPYAICCNNSNNFYDNFIFISDISLQKVLIFDSEFKYLSEFANGVCIEHMFIDDDDNVLYAAVPKHNLVSLWSIKASDDGITYFSQFSVKQPLKVQVAQHIYVISEKFEGLFGGFNQIDNYKKSIYIFDKNNYNLLEEIKYLLPISIFINQVDNSLITLAYQYIKLHYQSDNFGMNFRPTHKWSDSLYIFKINKKLEKGYIDDIQDIALNMNKMPIDIMWLDNKLIYYMNNQLNCKNVIILK